MTNAFDYAITNYSGEDSEDAIVDSLTELYLDELYDALDVNEGVHSPELHARLEEAIRDTVLENLNFSEVRNHIENNAQVERDINEAMRGEY